MYTQIKTTTGQTIGGNVVSWGGIAPEEIKGFDGKTYVRAPYTGTPVYQVKR